MELKLTPILAFAVESPDDEFRSSIKGYYRNLADAEKNAKGSGWYGSDGQVFSIALYEDEQNNLYEVKALGKDKQEQDRLNKQMKKSLVSKLTKEEIDFIKKNF